MLARLQQFTTLSLLAGALTWVAWFTHLGRPATAWLGALLILLGYAIFLAFEFVLLAFVHGSDPTPPAKPSQLLRAWCGEVVSAPRVFCWRQPFRTWAQPDHLPTNANGRRGVVLVHGFVCNRALWNPWMVWLRGRDVPFVAVNLEPVFGSIDSYPPIIETAVRDIESATGLAPVIVAHSMGGLAVRAWMRRFSSDSRVHRIVTIGTPHRGTWLARFALVANAMQMRVGSAWLRQLSATETPSRHARFTCFYGHCDNIVFPASTATLSGADNRHVVATAHVHMASAALVFREVERWLEPAPVASEPAPAAVVAR